MPERDYVCDILKVRYTGICDFKKLYQAMIKWFNQYDYDFQELDYKEYKEDGKRNLFVRWQADKPMNEYVRYYIQIEATLLDMKDVMVHKKKRLRTELSMEFCGYLAKDYEESWYRSSILKFIRECYDKFAIGSQLKIMEKELKDEVYKIMNEVKSYLNLQKL